MSDKASYSEYLETAVEAARAAGAIQLERLGSVHEVRYKGESDMVTEVDMMCERRIMEIISGRFPDHAILAEECGGKQGARDRWIVDPLDGTTNYAHAYPLFCASVAFEREGKIVVGAVYDPVADELFTAVSGSGAFLNGTPIRVSGVDRLEDAMLGTGFPYSKEERKGSGMKLFNRMIVPVQAIRRDGSAALNLCYVAAGRFDGFWEIKLNPWDIAAGWIIVEQAGGRVSRLDGSTMHISSPGIAASNGIIHDQMIRTLEGRP